jgi:hypothetical protein
MGALVGVVSKLQAARGCGQHRRKQSHSQAQRIVKATNRQDKDQSAKRLFVNFEFSRQEERECSQAGKAGSSYLVLTHCHHRAWNWFLSVLSLPCSTNLSCATLCFIMAVSVLAIDSPSFASELTRFYLVQGHYRT